MAEEPALVVDARGHRCPTPTLRLRRALDTITEGEAVRLLTDDPLAKIDIPHFVAANGYALISLIVSDGLITATIRKGG